MWIVLLAAMASAQDCPEVPPQVAAAWALYNDAELEGAKAAVRSAQGRLGCQARVVTTETLLELFRLDALISITTDDSKGATYATLRAVAAQHGVPPPAQYGPELAELYETWSARMATSLIAVRVNGGGAVYVDGRPVDPSRPLEVMQGEHLIQIDDGQRVASEVVDLSADHVVITGLPGAVPIPLPEPAPAPQPAVPVPEPVVPMPGPVTPTVSARRRPAWLWGPAVATGGVSAFMLVSGAVSEGTFDNARFDPDFVGCDRGEPCYPLQREALVRHNARVINTSYGVGYGLAAVTAGLVSITVIGLPGKKR